MNTDICVVGGGSGGFGAACAAARLGARVILIEAGNGLGGTSTWAGVNNYEPVAGATGLPQELCERLQKLPETITIQKRSESYSPERPWGLYDRSDETDNRLSLSRRTGMPIVFEPEAMANLMLDLLTEAGCDVRLNTRFTQLHIQGDRITSITTQNDQGEETIHADIFIDATANIHLASAAGCQTAIGTETPDVYGEPSAPEKPEMVLNNASLCYRITSRALPGPYGIPFRCLLPIEIQNLLVACRGASFSSIGASSCRLSRTMMVLGQAAGTAAALFGKDLHNYNASTLRDHLRKDGVALDLKTGYLDAMTDIQPLEDIQ